MPNHEALAMDWLKSGQKGPPLGSDRVKSRLVKSQLDFKIYITNDQFTLRAIKVRANTTLKAKMAMIENAL